MGGRGAWCRAVRQFGATRARVDVPERRVTASRTLFVGPADCKRLRCRTGIDISVFVGMVFGALLGHEVLMCLVVFRAGTRQWTGAHPYLETGVQAQAWEHSDRVLGSSCT